ncbi:MAG TPA: 2-C-methyl-D-erythritol 4-phosphate cytidylyltransferase, partial [bacterium]|nr:2-C-methyl-D-erythritol 4-phosphate cytidylyltransferase [bacterium]
TDDASLVERAGTKVVVAVGSYSNIKMTSPEDLPMFEYFLGQEVKSRLDSAVEQGAREGGRGGRSRRRRRRPRRRSPQKHEGAPARGGEGQRQRHPKEMKGAHHRDGVRHS